MRILEMRSARCWTQEELEEQAGVDQGSISKYETGLRTPTYETLTKIAKAFGVPLETLIVTVSAQRSRRIFLIVTAFKEEWQLELEFQLLRAIRPKRLSCSVLVPPEEFQWAHHLELQAEILDDKDDYLGGLVIVPVFGLSRSKPLMEFARRLGKPVVFIDQNPDMPVDKIPLNASFVSVNDKEGGKLAGTALLELARKDDISRVLVISGNAKPDRFNSFREIVSRSRRNIEITVLTDGEYDRTKAGDLAYNHLTEGVKTKRVFDVVYCTGDSMTLGCLDAITDIEWKGVKRPRVIGYDGVGGTRRMADKGRIARLVVQDPKEIAYASVEQLMKLHGGSPIERVIWVQPELYPGRV